MKGLMQYTHDVLLQAVMSGTATHGIASDFYVHQNPSATESVLVLPSLVYREDRSLP